MSPFQTTTFVSVLITGVVHPSEGDMSRETGRRVTGGMGPIKSWHICYSKAEAQASDTVGM